MADGAIKVRGLKELTKSFRGISKDLTKELSGELKAAAEPVRSRAEGLALTEIRNMPASPRWAGMRIGVSTARGAVFMVPAARSRRRTKRPNLARLLMERAMDPALAQNTDKVVANIDDLLGNLFEANGF